MRIILTLTWAILLSSSAWAMTIDPGFTQSAYEDEGQYSPNWGGGSGTGFHHGDGAASYFTTTNDLFIDSISYTGINIDDDPHYYEDGFFDVIIYNASLPWRDSNMIVPDRLSQIFSIQTNQKETPEDFDTENYYTRKTIDNVGLTLPAGSYWLAMENGTPWNFVSPSSALFEGSYANTPEPATIILMLTGMVVMGFLRKKRVHHKPCV